MTKIRSQEWETIYDRRGEAWKAPTRRRDLDRTNARETRRARRSRGWFRSEALRFAVADALRWVADQFDGGRRVK